MYFSCGSRKRCKRLAAVVAVPLVCLGISKAVPLLSAAAERLSVLTVGADGQTLPVPFLSAGFGWQTETGTTATETATTIATAAAQPAQTTITTTAGNPDPYPTQWQTGSGKIVRVTMKASQGTQFFELDKAGTVRNCSTHSNAELLAESRKAPAFTLAQGTAPQVLIMHTHTTESFEPFVRETYDSTFHYRTTDSQKNVILVGNAVQRELEAAGIGVIHDTTVHDYPSYNGSYGRSRVTVQQILKDNPGIRVVLDIHRDALTSGEDVLQPYAVIDGKEAAQVMVIAGCDNGTLNMPNYLKNFRFACRLQEQLSADYPTLTRPVLFDYRKYNQDLTTGSLLLEIGAHGNTLAQAEYAGTLTGKSLAKVLTALRE